MTRCSLQTDPILCLWCSDDSRHDLRGTGSRGYPVLHGLVRLPFLQLFFSLLLPHSPPPLITPSEPFSPGALWEKENFFFARRQVTTNIILLAKLVLLSAFSISSRAVSTKTIINVR